LRRSTILEKRTCSEWHLIFSQAEIGEKSKGKTREGANNPVTDGDMLSHRAMYYGMLKAFPGLSVISEEHDPQPIDMTTIALPAFTDSEVNAVISDDKDVMMSIEEVDVWIDPLDATQEYTENLLEFVTTMVCVAVRGKPVLGVIYKPFENLTAWGWVGPNFVSRIVEKDVRNNHAKEHHDVALSRLIVSRSHAGSVHDVAEAAFGSKATVTPAGGAGFKSWEVMKGVQDAYVHVTLIKKWDLCAGDAILRALGGQLTTLKGAPIDYSGRPAEERNEGGVIATMHDHDAYVEALKDVPVETKRKEP
jgi:inositol monophosphatase 3